jgi:hypothetical protein
MPRRSMGGFGNNTPKAWVDFHPSHTNAYADPATRHAVAWLEANDRLAYVTFS